MNRPMRGAGTLVREEDAVKGDDGADLRDRRHRVRVG